MKQMKKSDWEAKKKEFLVMQTKQKDNLVLVENTLEEIELFIDVVTKKIETFK